MYSFKCKVRTKGLKIKDLSFPLKLEQEQIKPKENGF